MPRRHRLVPVLAFAVLIPASLSAQTPAAPRTSQPQGPLGEQIAWLVETLNADPAT